MTQLLTQEQRKYLPTLGATEGITLEDKIVQAKLFTPWTSWTWYVIEFDGDDLCFGLVDGLEREYGYFTLSELSEITGPAGLKIERDKWFRPSTVSEVLATLSMV